MLVGRLRTQDLVEVYLLPPVMTATDSMISQNDSSGNIHDLSITLAAAAEHSIYGRSILLTFDLLLLDAHNSKPL